MKGLWFLLIALAGCTTVPESRTSEILMTDTHTLTVWSHCPEGEVGCAHLTGVLMEKQTGRSRELTGSTYVVKCADGVTPCHVGFYDLKSPGISVRAYPDGTLELESPGASDRHERGTWSY
jgi:hypothetical protein